LTRYFFQARLTRALNASTIPTQSSAGDGRHSLRYLIRLRSEFREIVELLAKVDRLLKKAAIIAQTLAEMKSVSSEGELNPSSDPEEEEIVLQTLEIKLKQIEPDHDIRTCCDFSHLHTECCEICHAFCPHYEMALCEVEGGGKAWICCAIDRAINPQKHSKCVSSAGYKTLAAILGWINYDQ
jgi:hypothetical protein